MRHSQRQVYMTTNLRRLDTPLAPYLFLLPSFLAVLPPTEGMSCYNSLPCWPLPSRLPLSPSTLVLATVEELLHLIPNGQEANGDANRGDVSIPPIWMVVAFCVIRPLRSKLR